MATPHNAQSEIPIGHPDGVLQRLRDAALRITGRSQSSRDRALIEMITTLHNLPAVSQQSHQPCDTPPAEVVAALRAPAGTQQLVVTFIGRRRLRAVINPIGRRDPEREAAVWRCLRDLAEEHAA